MKKVYLVVGYQDYVKNLDDINYTMTALPAELELPGEEGVPHEVETEEDLIEWAKTCHSNWEMAVRDEDGTVTRLYIGTRTGHRGI